MSVDNTILLEDPRWIYLSPSKQGKRGWDRDGRAKAVEELELSLFDLRFPCTRKITQVSLHWRLPAIAPPERGPLVVGILTVRRLKCQCES